MTELNLNGETDIPAGKISNIVTYLEMYEAPPSRESLKQTDLSLTKIDVPDLEWYRGVYLKIGEDLMWFSRVVMSDDKLSATLNDPKVEIFAPKKNGEDIGLLELDLCQFPDIEIAFFGLFPEAVGSGAGRWLMSKALELAWAHGPKRVWLHTCTIDHPAALPFYIRSGFKPYKRAVEVVDDPRLTGNLARSAAPKFPIIES